MWTQISTPVACWRKVAIGVLLVGSASCAPSGADEQSFTFRMRDHLLQVDGRLAAVGRDSIALTASLANVGTQGVHLQFGAAALGVQLHHTRPPVGGLAWDSRLSLDPVTGLPRAVPAIGFEVALAPGDSTAPFQEWLVPESVLGDSLPAGVYRAIAVLQIGVAQAPGGAAPAEVWLYVPVGKVRLGTD